MGLLGKIWDKAKSLIGKTKTIYGNISEGIGKVKDYTKQLRASKVSDRLGMLLSKYGDVKIIKLNYSRKPIQKAISTALSIASLGEVDKLKERNGYKDIYHDGLIIYLESGEVFRLEKNASIELNNFVNEDNELLFSVPFNKELTINILLNNGKEVGQSFYEYDHTKNNCQTFVHTILTKNNLMNSELEKNVTKQNAEEISATLPKDMNNIMHIATDLGSYTQDFQDQFKK
jgi:hypothetical protein